MKPSQIPLLLLLAPLFAPACSGPSNAPDLSLLQERRELQLAEQAAAEKRFRRDTPLPEERELERGGRLIIDHAELAGRLGDEIVRARITFVNNTEEAMVGEWIVLSVYDPVAELVHSVAEPVYLPRGLKFHAGSSYTTTLSVPTQGAHLNEGWSWGVEIEQRGAPDEE